MKKRIRAAALALAMVTPALLTVSMSGCNNTIEQTTSAAEKTKIEILTTGWVNTPTDDSDPYKKWIDDRYDVDVSLTATSDFSTQALIKFASDDPPDIVSFSSSTDFLKLYNQDSLITDWNNYLDQMTNV